MFRLTSDMTKTDPAELLSWYNGTATVAHRAVAIVRVKCLHQEPLLAGYAFRPE